MKRGVREVRKYKKEQATHERVRACDKWMEGIGKNTWKIDSKKNEKEYVWTIRFNDEMRKLSKKGEQPRQVKSKVREIKWEKKSRNNSTGKHEKK